MTALQTSFGVNNVALVHGRPKTLNLRDLIKYFIEHRHEVVIRRTQFDLRKAKERAHILEGLIIASLFLRIPHEADPASDRLTDANAFLQLHEPEFLSG